MFAISLIQDILAVVTIISNPVTCSVSSVFVSVAGVYFTRLGRWPNAKPTVFAVYDMLVGKVRPFFLPGPQCRPRPPDGVCNCYNMVNFSSSGMHKFSRGLVMSGINSFVACLVQPRSCLIIK